MSRPLSDLLSGIPDAPAISAQEVADAVAASGRILVVLDDDPTGTQSVADLPVVTGWSPESLPASLEWAFSTGAPAVYVMTNSRSLSPEDAEQRNRDVSTAAYRAAQTAGVQIGFVSRSDSTLRGHFPLETDVLAEEVATHTGEGIDGVVLVPAFGDAGRITVGGVHYMGNATDGYVPVAETEFARDATFGFSSSDLREWVAEKTDGAVAADDVAVLDLTTLRTDRAAAVALLTGLRNGAPCAVDIVEENDFRALALALDEAERQGARLLYRVGPPFVRGRLGQEKRDPLTAQEVERIRASREGGTTDVGGLIVVGSHVGLTTRQLDRLRADRSPVELEIDVHTVLDDARREAHLADLVQQASEALLDGDVVVRTSRTLVKGEDGQSSLDISRRISSAIVEVVAGVLAARPPRFVVAKGGITSSDVAEHGLGIERAIAVGPMLPGIVSLWEPVDGPAHGIPYIVFAGNVGDDSSLSAVVDTLSAKGQS
ncbi:MAG: four-carbon acid sugar kinase family protein [Mobilicoccus sp.]|nr:four-carbon acid sugar kinase family protein [Mobilicoccus sp.]